MAQQVLKSVDVNTDEAPASKRARLDDGEGKGGSWAPWILTKGEVILHDEHDRGIGRLDCVPDNLALDEDTIFNKNVDVDVSCVSMTPISRDKQLSILESALTKESLDKLTVGEWSNLMTSKPIIKPEDKMNYFDLLSDEVVLQIFRWIPKSNLRDIALTCSRFHRLSNDETLWTRMDVSNKHLDEGDLGLILSRQVIVLRLAKSTILDNPILGNCKAASEDFQCRLMYLDLSMSTISCESLIVVFNKCRKLKKISLENIRLNDEVLLALSANTCLEVVNLAMASGIKEDGLKYLLTNCKLIRELNVAWTYLNSNCIEYLCKNLPITMDRLNVAGCRKLLLDRNVQSLVACCPNLRELDLSDCTVITERSIQHITTLKHLTFIALSRCYMVSHESLAILFHLEY
ncbi:S-phase kinase-associated protein 2 isoform X2 [Anthonomus grandis grandis]|uniref:S-phase kinase-associated protein 2 isoform X2 n=1 Tax=Anthonomus grandis grandis TaxID=2921223 RepID=UPI002165B776|nr:S-phase kinase-associated protein 2 isoform X2 [Anthonomus grandis grandis]